MLKSGRLGRKSMVEFIYESDGIELRRQITFESNMKFIEEHNAHADEHGYTVKMNKFGDLVSLFNIAL